MRRLLAAAALLAAVGAACPTTGAKGEPTQAPAAVTVRTDALRYRAGQDIFVTIRNGLTHAIVTMTGRASCSVVSLDRRQARRWVEIRNCYAGVPPVEIRIAARATKRVRLPDRIQPGTYRARLEYRALGRSAEATSPAVWVDR